MKFELATLKKLAQKDRFIASALKNDSPEIVFNTYVLEDSALQLLYKKIKEQNEKS
jgi:hypothetical protein